MDSGPGARLSRELSEGWDYSTGDLPGATRGPTPTSVIYNPGYMSLFSWLTGARRRFGVAFGDRFLLAARLSGGPGHSVVAELTRQELPEGLLAPSAVNLNIRSVSELARLAGEALARIGCRGGRLGLLLPDLAARGFVFSSRANGSGAPHSGEAELLENLAARLPYPRAEAVVDTWRSGAGSVLAAAVRRPVLQQYEQTFQALGCRPSVVVPASMTRLPQWAQWAQSAQRADRARTSGPGLLVHVQLYPRHYTLSVFKRGVLVDVRLKLASQGAGPLVEEVARVPGFYDGAELERVSFSGELAREVCALAVEARLAPGRTELGEDSEEAHLVGLLSSVAPRI